MAPALMIEDERICFQANKQPVTAVKVGINGFGRIGRVVFRASLLRPEVVVVAINHTCASVDDLIHQISFDSTHGPLAKGSLSSPEIHAINENLLSVRGNYVHLISERDPAKIDWEHSGAEYIIESTGKFTTYQQAEVHSKVGGAKKVLISAPSKDAPTMVYGVNHNEYAVTKPTVISCASCTTNCLAPMAKVLNDEFGIVQGLMTTIHASTRSQHVLDGYSKRDRRAGMIQDFHATIVLKTHLTFTGRKGRAVLGNVIPTSTGAAKAVSSVLPELAGKLTGISLRVPICNVSLVDLTVNLEKPTSLREILTALETASHSSLKGVIQVEGRELVSCDFQGNAFSAVVDAKACVELNSQFFKILAWYDNEWAYSSRLLDMLTYMSKVDLTDG